ncbi:hypothetical protein BSKO_11420 [Bryopsis sp. KO-2023]|nr:hypothetical protein BSKO_11420 [Bryopsis sp. KO-2023]
MPKQPIVHGRCSSGDMCSWIGRMAMRRRHMASGCGIQRYPIALNSSEARWTKAATSCAESTKSTESSATLLLREAKDSGQDREIPVLSQLEPDLESGLPPMEADEGRYRHGGIPDHITFIPPPRILEFVRTNSTASGSGDEAVISIEDIPEPYAAPRPYNF